MSRHKVFCAFGAYAVDVSDPARTLIMPVVNGGQLPTVDPTKLVALDLQKRLKAAAWDEVIVDTTGLNEKGEDLGVDWLRYPRFGPTVDGDFERGINVLTVGPMFPGQNLGGIYLERTKFFTEVRPLFDPTRSAWPQPGLVPYELMSSALLVNGQVLRYHGFHAKVIESVGSTKKLSVKQSIGGPATITVDLADRTMCDDPILLAEDILDPAHLEQNSVLLTPKSEQDAQGAVFLALSRCVAAEILGPKEPIGAGD